ncbi:hypothetical protein ASG25_05085 [Rhizobium sp. Leaf384]|uniref:hypothetical protein n=1 Tax=unclassified Rhizobium TaxID=2613769 RepID=UPI000713BB81|nr:MULTISPECIES: hypothetical protein [unclassified Rhizobium]KQR77683.1 hypothetical protein ASG03_14920 [Rhizobium sp. Leaf341]KQS80900.1 hypothetical protein ASG25_05085 [Rhizobium sp. Leaf384]KQS86760.1 hypothetical protein ASG58_00385 [Rhizobium sp. Leaf383]
MRPLLCALLLSSTALLAGCVDDGYRENSVRYDSGPRYSSSGVYIRQSRYDTDRVPVYIERDRRPDYDRYDRYDRSRDDRRDRDSSDRRIRREAADRDRGDNDNRFDRDDDRRTPRRPVDICEYPCIR